MKIYGQMTLAQKRNFLLCELARIEKLEKNYQYNKKHIQKELQPSIKNYIINQKQTFTQQLKSL